MANNIKNLPSDILEYNIRLEDDIINVNTSVNAITLYLPNIKNSNLVFSGINFCINDISNNAGTNNITIVGSGGDLVNGDVSKSINTNNGSCVVNICSPIEWLLSKDQDGEAIVPPLNEVLVIGNTTGGTDISVSTGDKILFDNSSISFDDTIADYLVFQNDGDGFLFGTSGVSGTDAGNGLEIDSSSNVTFIYDSATEKSLSWSNQNWSGVNPKLTLQPLAQTNTNIQTFQDASGTIALTSQLTGDGIYDGSGTTPSATEVTITDTLNFNDQILLNSVTKRVGINNITPTVSIHAVVLDGNGMYIDGSSTSANEYILKLRNSSGTELNRFRNSGRVELSTNGNQVTMGNYINNNTGNWARQYIQEFQQFSNTALYTGFNANRGGNKIAMRAYSSNSGTIDSTGDMKLRTNWDGNFNNHAGTLAVSIDTSQRVAIGTATTSGARLTVMGSGNTSATNTVKFLNLSGSTNFIQNDEGQIATGANSNASISSSFGQFHYATGYNNGFGFYANNSPSAGMSIQMIGTTATGLLVASQANNTGTNYAIRGLMGSTNGTNNYGIYGLAEDATNQSFGVYGYVSNNTTASTDSSGIYGLNSARMNYSGHGGLFHSTENNNSIVFTNVDFIGVEGKSLGATNAGNTGVKSIGGKFTAINGDSNIALLIPETGNSGKVVIGADDVSGTSMVQVTGDIEILDNTKGIILHDVSDGNKYRITTVNGVIDTTLIS